MINGLEGIPGSGKSYEAVVYHILPTLRAGRKVVTNLPLVVAELVKLDPAMADLIELRLEPAPVRGTFDITRMKVDKHGNVHGVAFELFDDGHVEPAPPNVQPFGHVWDYYDTWKGADGNGPLFVIDESHEAMPEQGTSQDVVQWFKRSRHFNADVLLLTQEFRDMNQAIARLIAIKVRCRKADVLGKPSHYIRKVHAGYRGAVISTEQRPYLSQYFALYRSHTQGNSVAESSARDVKPFYVWFKWFTRCFLVLTFVGICWAFWPKSAKPVLAKAASPVSVEPGASVLATAQREHPSARAAPAHPASAAVPSEPAESPDPEPFGGRTLHLAGMVKMGGREHREIVVAVNGVRVTSVTARDLEAMGYRVRWYNDCAGVVRWGKRAQSVICDAPKLADATSSRPVVIEVEQGTNRTVASSVPLPPAGPSPQLPQ